MILSSRRSRTGHVDDLGQVVCERGETLSDLCRVMTRKQAETLCFAARDKSSPYCLQNGHVASADRTGFAWRAAMGRPYVVSCGEATPGKRGTMMAVHRR